MINNKQFLQTQAKEKTNDDSNPQQGTASRTTGTMPSSSSFTIVTSSSHYSTMSANMADYSSSHRLVAPSSEMNSNTNPATATTAITTTTTTTTQQHDNKNKQQGNQFKIPPNRRDSRKLFIGGLPGEVRGEEFRLFFQKFGSILDSVVMIDHKTKCSRGFGFVTFEDPDVANKLLLDNLSANKKKSTIKIRKKFCEIKASVPKKGGFHHSNSAGKLGSDNGSDSVNGSDRGSVNDSVRSLQRISSFSSHKHKDARGNWSSAEDFSHRGCLPSPQSYELNDHYDNGYYPEDGFYHPPYDPNNGLVPPYLNQYMPPPGGQVFPHMSIPPYPSQMPPGQTENNPDCYYYPPHQVYYPPYGPPSPLSSLGDVPQPPGPIFYNNDTNMMMYGPPPTTTPPPVGLEYGPTMNMANHPHYQQQEHTVDTPKDSVNGSNVNKSSHLNQENLEKSST